MSVKSLARPEPVGPTTPVKFLELGSKDGSPEHCINVTFIVSITSGENGGATVELANGKSVHTTQSVSEISVRLMDHKLSV